MTQSIHAPRSIFHDGDWHDAHWMPEIVDEATGELTLLATSADLTAGQTQPRIVVVRLTSDLVRALRWTAGFTDPPAVPATTDRMAVLNEELARQVQILTNAINEVGSRVERVERRQSENKLPAWKLDDVRAAYDPENDVSPVSWVDMRLLSAIEMLAS